MNNENPLVTVIVRTKNRPSLLTRALLSIHAQAYRPIEVVLVNDGGCDLDLSGIKECLGDITLNYICSKKNRGRALAGNIGIRNVNGKYLGFLDDDDQLYTHHISTLVDYMKKSKSIIAYTGCEVFEYEKNGQDGIFNVKEKYLFCQDDYSYERLLTANYIPLMCLMFDSKIRHDICFDSRFDLFEDWDLLIRLAGRYLFHHIPETTARYNHGLSEQISADGNTHYRAFVRIAEKHKNRISTDVLFEGWKQIIHRRELLKQLLATRSENAEIRRSLMEKNEQAKRQEEIIHKIKNVVTSKEIMIRKQKRQIEENELTISERYSEVRELQLRMDRIEASLGWQILEATRGYIERILPVYSRRRYYYDLVVKSLKVIRAHGFEAFIMKASRKIRIKCAHEKSENRQVQFIPLKNVSMKPLDIILPVYNAYDDFQECIKSIRKYTDLTFHRLLVIDDRSTDTRIVQCLARLKENITNENITILGNQENKGFAGTVNRGMQHSERDVVILNSDTIVTKNWLEKLSRAARSNPRISTVTPFSNNATICSIPEICENNPIPDGFSIDSFSEFIERTSARYYPQIPTGVGFCMYISRESLNDVGYFDERHFRGGYGEENDFCWRASRKGYMHILDDATFIYHRGGASYTAETKITQELKAIDIMQKIHPDYIPVIQNFIQKNPLRPIHNCLQLRLALAKGEHLSAPGVFVQE
jgi:GT2 family glycosyltransferase